MKISALADHADGRLANIGGCLFLSGEAEGVQRARESIQDIAEEYAATHFSIFMPASYIPKFIGSKGSNIKKITKETEAKINILKESNIVTITGTREQVKN